LRGVRVTLTNERTSAQRVILTTENGAYVFTPVDAGTYALAAELSGFVSAVRQHLTVASHQRLNVELSLAPKPSGSDGQTAEARGTSRAKGAGSGQTFGQFDYDDKPNYKPGDIASSSEPGGYSSGANADSYDLILAYVEGESPSEPRVAENENGTDRRSATRSTAPPRPDGVSGEQGPRSEIDEAALQAWNENQFFSHGSDLLLHREFAPANDLFQRGVARFPDSAKLQMGLGIALYARGLYDQAVKALLHATDMVPSDPRPYLLLARAYSVSHSQNDAVVKHLEHLVEIDPKSAPARCYYALSLWRSAGEKPDANAGQIERLLKDAVALDPQFVDAHLELGALYAEQAKYSDAIPEYRRAIAINPGLAAAHYRLAQVYARTGDRAAAETELGLYEHLREAGSKK
jgi:tetratricopeptide (TPR) repeat protein